MVLANGRPHPVEGNIQVKSYKLQSAILGSLIAITCISVLVITSKIGIDL